ncbi:sulfurtransferase [Microbispora sp. NPDC049125]|uniref:sulfurtransferase n=1 Tax=Microbispora sp. NPDC049125 TaxID=3154929 RepID=UPI0034661748
MSRSHVLVDAAWVLEHLDDPGVVLAEVDENSRAYDENHIRGAVKIDWREDLQDPVRRDFVGKAGFEDEVIGSIGTKSIADVRSPDEFSGKILGPTHLPHEQAQVAGHIPTARNVPWSRAAADDGTFKSDEELRRLYAGASVDPDAEETIVYCRIGERSAHTWFVLSELLDRPGVKNYDGSWAEYGSLVGVPVERGPAS